MLLYSQNYINMQMNDVLSLRLIPTLSDEVQVG